MEEKTAVDGRAIKINSVRRHLSQDILYASRSIQLISHLSRGHMASKVEEDLKAKQLLLERAITHIEAAQQTVINLAADEGWLVNIREAMKGLKEAHSGLHQENIEVAVEEKKALRRGEKRKHQMQMET